MPLTIYTPSNVLSTEGAITGAQPPAPTHPSASIRCPSLRFSSARLRQQAGYLPRAAGPSAPPD